jgi:hypothetical protein
MATNQPLKTAIINLNIEATHSSTPAVVRAVELGEFVLSVSTMLGCDYIFVSHSGPHALLSTRHLHRTIRELLDMLDTSPRQSLVVSADELPNGELKFTRYDYIWENRKVTRVDPNHISHPDQIDFMQMMFECSSTC